VSWYLPERRTLFLHVPRTGGTWVKEALYQSGIPIQKWGKIGEPWQQQKHTIPMHVRTELMQKVNLMFAFVRRPVEYYISVWRFTCRSVKQQPDKMKLVFDRRDPAVHNEAILRWKPDFRDWLAEMLEEEPGWATRWFERYVGPERGEYCHYIGRTETVEQDFREIMDLLGFGNRWRKNEDKINRIHHAKNRIRVTKAPHIQLTDTEIGLIERSERVLLRRFYGETTVNRRVYRNFETGEPAWVKKKPGLWDRVARSL